MTAQSLDGKVALLAGVGRHIGLRAAMTLSAAGAKVAVSDVDTGVATEAAGAVEAANPAGFSPVMALTCDVRREADCERTVASVVDGLGQLDILVCSVGRSSFGLALDMTADLFRQEVDATVVGSFLMAQAAAREMVRVSRGGRIVMVSSGAAERARKGGISHSASKAGVNMIVKVMAVELGEHGVNVNAVAPGLVPRAGHVSSAEHRQRISSRLPLGRLGRADDVTGAVMFLVSDAASWITGEVIHVDGGAGAGDASLPPNVAVPKSTY